MSENPIIKSPDEEDKSSLCPGSSDRNSGEEEEEEKKKLLKDEQKNDLDKNESRNSCQESIEINNDPVREEDAKQQDPIEPESAPVSEDKGPGDGVEPENPETSNDQQPDQSDTLNNAENKSDVDDPELEIAGPATAAEDILNEEELLDPAKDDEKLESVVVEWMEQSSLHKLKDQISLKKDLSSLGSRKSQRIVSSIIKRSIKCLNKMHAMDCATTSPGDANKSANDKPKDVNDDGSTKVPINRQNGATLPVESSTVKLVPTGRVKIERVPGNQLEKENHSNVDDSLIDTRKKSRSNTTITSNTGVNIVNINPSANNAAVSGKDLRKRRSTDDISTNGNSKRICFEQRERFIDSLVGCERISADELAARAEELRSEVQALDELARAKEMEWNEILSMRKLKEEAYLRVERKRQVMGFLESNNGQMSDSLPPASLSLMSDWDESSQRDRRTQESDEINDERSSRSRLETLRDDSQMMDDDTSTVQVKREDLASVNQKSSRNISVSISKHSVDNVRKPRRSVEQIDNRQIGEGRQGPIVDVKSIIADYRLRHPETVPRRGRRMRNSVNLGLGTGGAVIETMHGDSRPSSTDSCKSNPNPNDINNSMSFKDVLVQFAKLSQQQGEPVKTPQNYPDVTLHPVAPSPITINSTAQPSGSLLHGILTKSQSPRPTTFSPTLARLLTAPERERHTPPSGSSLMAQGQAAQHLLQAYQNTNSVSITDLLSSSKARTEITITPVVNPSIQSSHSNNVVHVDDVEEDNSVDERDTRRGSSIRDNREDRDTPPRCQGCNERAAQFVCAGCGNQWYCSRECQVSAWDEHSEVCSG